MTTVLFLAEELFVVLAALFALFFVVSSVQEREKRAAAVGAFMFLLLLGIAIALLGLYRAGFFDAGLGAAALLVIVVISLGTVLLVTRRTVPNTRALKGTAGYVRGEVKRFDERDMVFVRNRVLRPGSKQYGDFYAEHPAWEKIDAERRQRGGTTGVPGAIDKPGGAANVAAAAAAHEFARHLSSPRIVMPEVPEPFRGARISMSPQEAVERVKGYAKHLGAVLVGITRVDPLWVYAKRGAIPPDNWDNWGREIQVDHPYAILFAVEMDRELVWTAPHTPIGIETGVQYAKVSFIGAQVASFIANLGYSATANQLGHYDVLLVPMAVNAGLGEISRMGYVITKEYGPRIRLGAVTTDLPLVADRPIDIGVEDFCTVCKKCAQCCPSQSIPFEEPAVVNGTLRWKLAAETCFDYWGKVGTDCNRCMRVCPWSHPRTLPHRLVIEAVTRNRFARRIFSPLDDLFYGKKPRPGMSPKWATYR